jgi:hypothetical protein
MDARPEEEVEPVNEAAVEKPVALRSDKNTQQGMPVEIHPPHAPAHSAKDFLIQLLTITAGVLIALSIEGLLEWNHHRMLVRQARATIAREIADNKRALDGHLASSDERAGDVETSLRLANELLTTKKSDIRKFQLNFHFPSLGAAAWQSAERTGALAHMDYSDVQLYAKLYGVQDLYVAQRQRLLDGMVSALSILEGDPHAATPNDLERFRHELLALRGELLIDEQIGKQLSDAYKEVLAKP